MDDYLVFENVSKKFGDTVAVDDVSFAIREGEIFSILGPSGCGKTTLLRMVAGFLKPDEGRILLGGEDISGLPPEKRPVNTVFQSYALFPHMSVRQNIGFGLKMAKRPAKEIASAVDAMLELVGLSEQADKRPGQMSGGQRQRVAIARALVNRPRVLLLDEPLAALDLKLRQRLLVQLDEIHDEVGTTFVYVTHDQGEAMGISDRIAVMETGQIAQIGPPAEIYEAPVSSFVAAFVGDTNFLQGAVSEVIDEEYSRMRIDGLGEIEVYNDRKLQPGEAIDLSLRPEKIQMLQEEPDPSPHSNTLAGVVEDVISFGSLTRYWIKVGDLRFAAELQHNHYRLDHKFASWGDPVWIRWHADDGYLLQRFNRGHVNLLSLGSDND